MKRATGSTAKAARREAILLAAGDAFDRLGFAATSMEWLADRAGIAKGTLYLYFPTKEAVFLALYRRALAAWFEQLDAGIERLAANDSLAFAGLAADALTAQPRLPALAAILHIVIERNLGADDVLAFRQELLASYGKSGGRLEARFDCLLEGDGVRLLQRVHALLIGCWHAATPAPVPRRLLEREELAALRVDFSEEFENVLVLLLEGWRHAGGGF